MFSPKDQKILKKYFAPEPPKKAYVAPPSDGSVSTMSHKSFNIVTDDILPSGKKKYNVYKTPEEEKADQKKERETMASEDSRRISRLARLSYIAAKKRLPPIISKREE